MNTFWLKIVGLAVVALGVIIVISIFSSSETAPETEDQTKPKGIYEQWERDDKRLRAEPQFKEPPKTTTPVQPSNQTQTTVEQPKTVEPAKPQFRELSEIENIDAEQLFNNAIQFRKIGRLPGPKYKVMVDACRLIIQKYPGSEWAWKARKMLADIPEHYRSRYKITEEEIDLGNFK